MLAFDFLFYAVLSNNLTLAEVFFHEINLNHPDARLRGSQMSWKKSNALICCDTGNQT